MCSSTQFSLHKEPVHRGPLAAPDSKPVSLSTRAAFPLLSAAPQRIYLVSVCRLCRSQLETQPDKLLKADPLQLLWWEQQVLIWGQRGHVAHHCWGSGCGKHVVSYTVAKPNRQQLAPGEWRWTGHTHKLHKNVTRKKTHKPYGFVLGLSQVSLQFKWQLFKRDVSSTYKSLWPSWTRTENKLAAPRMWDVTWRAIHSGTCLVFLAFGFWSSLLCMWW